jgi:tetratricopeptide (TPR) repeat protein
MVFSATYSPDGSRIVTASDDRTAKVWDARTGTETLSLKHRSRVQSATYSPDGTRIVTASVDKTARVWHARTGAEIFTLKGHIGFVSSATYSPNGTRIATASEDKTAKVWDAGTGAELFTLKGHTDVVSSASFSPDGTRIVTASWDGTAKVWDARTGAEILTLKGHTNSVMSATYSPDGTRIVTASGDKTAKVWDTRTGTETLSLKHRSFVYAATYSPDGTRIITAGEDGTKVWDARPMHPDLLPGEFAWWDALLARGYLDEAIAAYKKALRLSPQDPLVSSRLGLALTRKADLLMGKGDRDGAIAAYREALRLNPKDADTHTALGVALQGQGDLDGAIAAYQEALHIDPKHPGATAKLTEAKRLRHLPDIVAGKEEPKTPDEGCAFAELCGQPSQKRYVDAVRLFEKAFAADPRLAENPPTFHRYNAACYAALAARGEGVGGPTEPRKRAALRAKALAWLKADLAYWKDKVGSKQKQDRQLAESHLAHWLVDDDLRETRPQAKREGWTEQESRAWDQLWSAVRQSLAEAGKKQDRPG